MEKETVVKIVENAYNKIKRENPYTNFKFVSDLIGDKVIAEEVKKIIVSKDKNAPKLVLDLLFENNCASKYIQIADYMNYPLIVSEDNEWKFPNKYHDDDYDEWKNKNDNIRKALEPLKEKLLMVIEPQLPKIDDGYGGYELEPNFAILGIDELDMTLPDLIMNIKILSNGNYNLSVLQRLVKTNISFNELCEQIVFLIKNKFPEQFNTIEEKNVEPDETLKKLEVEIHNYFKQSDFPNTFGIVIKTIGNDCVQITTAKKFKIQIIPNHNSKYSLIATGNIYFTNLKLSQVANKAINLIDSQNNTTYKPLKENLSLLFDVEDDNQFDSELEDLESKIWQLVREQDFPVEWGVDVTKLTNDCVEVKGKGGLNFHIIPQENGNYTLMVSGQKRKENVGFDVVSDEIVNRVNQRHADVNYL